jgi:hypothetical protein
MFSVALFCIEATLTVPVDYSALLNRADMAKHILRSAMQTVFGAAVLV